MPKCPSCRHLIAVGAERCKKCGAPLSWEPQTAGAAPAGEAGDDGDQEILALLREGQKIAAIKLYREREGVGLKEAKDAVEALAARHDIAPQRAGCAAAILAVLSALLATALAANLLGLWVW